MGIILEVARRFRASVKLERGRCENYHSCGRILRDDAEPVRGYRVCSDECAHTVWLDSF